MALNMCEMWSNGIEIAFFQKLTKSLLAAGHVCDTFELH